MRVGSPSLGVGSSTNLRNMSPRPRGFQGPHGLALCSTGVILAIIGLVLALFDVKIVGGVLIIVGAALIMLSGFGELRARSAGSGR